MAEMFQHHEWLLAPAVGTFLVATFTARSAMRRGLDAAALALSAVVLSMLASIAAGLIHSPASLLKQLGQPATIVLAIVGGVAGGAGMSANFIALRQGATGPVTTITSLSILVPIGLAFLGGWDDSPFTASRLAGVILALVGTTIIHIGRGPQLENERFHWSGLAVAAMLCYGVSQAAQKYVTVVDPLPGSEPRYGFMAAYCFAATLVLLAYLQKVRRPVQLRAWSFALPLAAASFIQFLCMLVLLQHVETALVYITFTGGGALLVLLISTLVLGEQYRPFVWTGCLLVIAGIVLVRL